MSPCTDMFAHVWRDWPSLSKIQPSYRLRCFLWVGWGGVGAVQCYLRTEGGSTDLVWGRRWLTKTASANGKEGKKGSGLGNGYNEVWERHQDPGTCFLPKRKARSQFNVMAIRHRWSERMSSSPELTPKLYRRILFQLSMNRKKKKDFPS